MIIQLPGGRPAAQMGGYLGWPMVHAIVGNLVVITKILEVNVYALDRAINVYALDRAIDVYAHDRDIDVIGDVDAEN